MVVVYRSGGCSDAHPRSQPAHRTSAGAKTVFGSAGIFQFFYSTAIEKKIALVTGSYVSELKASEVATPNGTRSRDSHDSHWALALSEEDPARAQHISYGISVMAY